MRAMLIPALLLLLVAGGLGGAALYFGIPDLAGPAIADNSGTALDGKTTLVAAAGRPKSAGAASAAPATAAAPSAEPRAAVAEAPPKPKLSVVNTQTYGDWFYSCLAAENSTTKQCSIVQELSNGKTKAVLFVWRIVQDGKGGLLGVWETPTGLMIDRGIVLDAGTPKPIAIPFRSCSAGGCEAVATLAPDFRDTLSKTEKISATIFSTNGQGVSFNIGTKGLSAAIAALN